MTKPTFDERLILRRLLLRPATRWECDNPDCAVHRVEITAGAMLSDPPCPGCGSTLRFAPPRPRKPYQKRRGSLCKSNRLADRVADSVGFSRHTFAKAEAVIEAAKADPKRFGPIVKEMNATGNVHGAFRRARETFARG